MRGAPIVHLGTIAPFDPISAGISVGLLAFTAWMNRRGPKQKVASTSIVNELEPVLQQNVADYMAGPRTRSAQAAHLAQFDQAWAYLKSGEGCGNPELGKPGANCIADRSRGGRWPWPVYYRDPIANDPDVQPDPAEAFGGGAAGANVDVLNPKLLLLGAAAAVLLAVS